MLKKYSFAPTISRSPILWCKNNWQVSWL